MVDLSHIPSTCGVYLMKDHEDRILYVGKSKHLKTRVRSYFNREHKQEKLNRLVKFVASVEYIETDTHLDAVLLEIELIKRYRPEYNKQFKKESIYYFCESHQKNELFKFSSKNELLCYGPFRSKRALLILEDFFRKAAPLNSMNFSLKVIPVRLTQKEREDSIVKIREMFESMEVLDGMVQTIRRKMKEASDHLLFEDAKYLKDVLYALEHVKKTIFMYHPVYMVYPLKSGYKVYFIKNLQVVGSLVCKNPTKEIFERLVGEPPVDYCLDDQMVIYREIKENKDYCLDANRVQSFVNMPLE